MTETKTAAKKAATTKKHTTLAEALVAFQADLPTVSLDSTNPHFKSKFTSLGNLTTTVIPRLNAQGLAYTATSRVTEDGKMVVVARLMHSSGEELTAEFPITDTAPQKAGSAVTYARRYLLAALTGVVADQDDDGNAASAPAPKPLANVRDKVASKPPAGPSEASLKARIRTEFIEGKGIDKDTVNELHSQYKGEGLSGMKLYATVIEALEKI